MIPSMGLLQVALLALLVAAYYRRIVRLVGEPMARRALAVILERSPSANMWSRADMDGVSRLVLAGIMQLIFVSFLVILFPIHWSELLPGHLNPILLLLGVILGIAEAALGSQLAFLAFRLADTVQRNKQPMSMEAWLTVARGGWMRYYVRTAAVAPRPLLVGVTALYVVGEELVFRGVVLGATAPRIGAGFAGCLSVVLFLLAQVSYTPGWRTALFPLVGALVVGVVHAYLYTIVPEIAPLMVAHVTMFLVAVL